MSRESDRWRRADEIFDAALEVDAAERTAWLDRECGGDAELRTLVDRLLSRVDSDAPLLEGGDDLSVIGDDETVPAGERVDRYRVIREIGRGGMAVVYLAERAEAPAPARAARLMEDAVARGFAENRLRPMEFGGEMGTRAVTAELLALIAEAGTAG